MQASFTKSVTSLEKKTYVFHFNRIYTVSGLRYHISFRTHGHISHYVMMEEDTNGWYFSDIALLPHWLLDMEKILGNVIQKNIKKG